MRNGQTMFHSHITYSDAIEGFQEQLADVSKKKRVASDVCVISISQQKKTQDQQRTRAHRYVYWSQFRCIHCERSEQSLTKGERPGQTNTNWWPKWASGNILNGVYLTKYLLSSLKILDLGGDW